MAIDLKKLNPYTFDGDTITCNGDYNLINWSDIRDKLIRLAAKNTEQYASDVIYGIAEVEKALSENPESGSWYFGFRECGVDYEDYIREAHPHTVNHYYRCIWQLDLKSDPQRCKEKTLRLYRVKYIDLSMFQANTQTTKGEIAS